MLALTRSAFALVRSSFLGYYIYLVLRVFSPIPTSRCSNSLLATCCTSGTQTPPTDEQPPERRGVRSEGIFPPVIALRADSAFDPSARAPLCRFPSPPASRSPQPPCIPPIVLVRIARTHNVIFLTPYKALNYPAAANVIF